MTPTETIGPPAYGDRMSTATDELTDLEREILAFERQWFRHRAGHDQAVRDQFGMSSVRYAQVLNALLDRPQALREHPVLVKRLRRLRAARRSAVTTR